MKSVMSNRYIYDFIHEIKKTADLMDRTLLAKISNDELKSELIEQSTYLIRNFCDEIDEEL